MNKARFLKLLAKMMAGTISKSESELLSKAKAEQTMLYSLFAAINSYKVKDEQSHDDHASQLAQVWSKIEQEDSHFKGNFNYDLTQKHLLNAKIIRIAAVVTLSVCIGISWYIWQSYKSAAAHTVMAKNQKVYKILDDGTKLWLNKDSKVSYNADFGKYKRVLYLEGEAYFDVVKNQAIPLTIHAGEINIEVKGTAFNVRAYKASSSIEIALIRGSVEVRKGMNSKAFILMKPNDELTFSKSAARENRGSFSVHQLSPDLLSREIRWTIDTLIFKKEKLSILALRMEQKYDVKIEIQSTLLKDKRFSGSFSNQTIQEALEALSLSYPLNYQIKGKLVVIKD